jgi:transcriptional regulator with XRE-family HTH domain
MSHDTIVNTFRRRLRLVRLDAGMTQAELGAKLKVHHSQISQWERGARLPGLHSLRRLAKALGTSTDYLLGISHT